MLEGIGGDGVTVRPDVVAWATVSGEMGACEQSLDGGGEGTAECGSKNSDCGAGDGEPNDGKGEWG